MGKVYSFLAYSVALIVAVGYVVIDVGVELLQKFVHQRHGCASVHVVVAIDEDALLTSHGVVETIHGDVHVFHQEWVDEVGQLWAEKAFRRRFGGNASMDEKQCQDRADAQLVG